MAGLIVLAGALYVNFRFVQQSPLWSEFLPAWNAMRAWVAGGETPYNPDVRLQIQEMLYGRPAVESAGEHRGSFLVPFPAALLFLPFSQLPYIYARTLWMVVLEVCLLGTAYYSWQMVGPVMRANVGSILLIMSLGWYFGLQALVLAQPSLLAGFFIASALRAMQLRRDLLAGGLLVLSLLSPQISFLLFVFVLMWAWSTRRWTLLFSSLGFSLIWLMISFVILPNWIEGWILELARHLMQIRELEGSFTALVGLLWPPFANWGGYVMLALLGGYIIYEWIVALGKSFRWFQWTAAMTLAITCIIGLLPSTHNLSVLWICYAVIFAVWIDRWERRGEISAIISMLLILIVSWAFFFLPDDFRSAAYLARTMFPVLVIPGLWWVRWWKVQAIVDLPLNPTEN